MSENPPSPSAAPRYTPTQRRLLTFAAGLSVVALAAGSFVLSYDDLRALALQGGASKRYAPLYAFMIDGLVVVTILSLIVARQAHWWSRWVRWVLLLVLVGGAATASAYRVVQGYGSLPHKWVSLGVAIAPWLILLLAVWLWLAMFKHVRTALAHSAPADQPITPSPAEPEAARPERVEAAKPRPTSASPAAGRPKPAQGTAAEAGPDEPEPDEPEALIPGLKAEPAPTKPPAPAPPKAAQPKHVKPQAKAPKPAEERPSPQQAAPAQPKTEPAVPATLPTDVKLVGRPPAKPALKDTHPEGLPIQRPQVDVGAEEDTDEPTVDRAEDPDAGEDEPTASTRPATDAERWSEEAAEDARQWAAEAAGRFGGSEPEDERTTTVEWTPPASKFRSSPTPPRD